MQDINSIKYQIEGLLQLTKQYTIIYEDSCENAPYIHNTTIHIGKCEHWNQIYQLSHELLHAAYSENNSKIIDYMYIEEILCEAFSIYCLKRFCRDEYVLWKSYLTPYMYYCNGYTKSREIISSEGITSIQELNNKLKEYKTYATRQFIHPFVLLLVNYIDFDFNLLRDTFKYTKYINTINKPELLECIDIFIKEKQLI